METIITWAKENYQLIVLAVSVAGVLLAILSLILETRKKKEKGEPVISPLRNKRREDSKKNLFFLSLYICFFVSLQSVPLIKGAPWCLKASKNGQ